MLLCSKCAFNKNNAYGALLMIRLLSRGLAWATLLLSLSGLLWPLAAAAHSAATSARAQALPAIVFVHGFSGSASQFETQAMRFTSNGYPQKRLYAFEYDTAQDFAANAGQVLRDLDAFIDRVRRESGGQKIYLVAHSLGTQVSISYLETFPGGNSKVARYASLDGRSLPHLPGGVPTLGIWGEWNSGGQYARSPERSQIGPNPQDNHYFPNKSHTEVATSAEAFGLIYRFFLGIDPATRRVVPERTGLVTVAGRAVLFPQNAGYPQATLQLWRVQASSGQRIGSRPLWSQRLGSDGRFGPLPVTTWGSYEFALLRPDGSVHHFYQQPFIRSDHFLRLNSSLPGTGLDAVVPKSPLNTVLTLSRQRELWGDQGQFGDRLSVNGTELLTPATAPRAQVTLGFYAFDAGLDGQTDLGKGMLPPFNSTPFLSAADVFIPASPTARGRVRISLRGRDVDRVMQVTVPNWPSATDRVSVQFADYVQPFGDYNEYLQHRLRCKIGQRLQRPVANCE
jgi:pimeloyl-ACP methyl ester carboxylesterase